MRNSARVTVLMNCYNGELYLREAIESVCAQTYKNWEIVFIDNKSTDQSVEIAREYGDKIRIISTPQFMSLYEARKFGLQFCDGDYLAILDCDDYWFPKKLQTQMDLAFAGEDFIFTDFEDLYEKRPKFHFLYKLAANIRRNSKPQGRFDIDSMLKRYDFNLQTVLINSNLLDGISFDPKYDIIGDLDFFIKIALKANSGPYYLAEATAVTRVHPKQLSGSSSDKWEKEFEHLLQQKYVSKLSSNSLRALSQMANVHRLVSKINSSGEQLAISDLTNIDLNSPSRLWLFSKVLLNILRGFIRGGGRVL